MGPIIFIVVLFVDPCLVSVDLTFGADCSVHVSIYMHNITTATILFWHSATFIYDYVW